MKMLQKYFITDPPDQISIRLLQMNSIQLSWFISDKGSPQENLGGPVSHDQKKVQKMYTYLEVNEWIFKLLSLAKW